MKHYTKNLKRIHLSGLCACMVRKWCVHAWMHTCVHLCLRECIKLCRCVRNPSCVCMRILPLWAKHSADRHCLSRCSLGLSIHHSLYPKHPSALVLQTMTFTTSSFHIKCLTKRLCYPHRYCLVLCIWPFYWCHCCSSCYYPSR